jgi:hypothetical protein
MQKIFTHISRVNLWESSESVSGRGSELATTQVIRTQLPELFQEFNINSILDAPCGDFNWMRQLDRSSIRYTGIDVVAEIIDRNQQQYGDDLTQFLVGDITSSELPTAEAIFCRDCWVHLSLWDISRALDRFKLSGSKYLFSTTYPETTINRDTATGSWRALNLCLPPFNFPQPLKLIADPSDDTGANPDKSLAIWRLEDLSSFTVSQWSSPQMMVVSLIRKYLSSSWQL